jgi:hypothetical protein
VADDGGHSGREGADELLALALAQGQTVRDAAVTAGVSERTATRRWADADFRRRVSALRDDMVSRAVGTLADSMTEAAIRLRELLRSPNDTVCLGAAKALLELPFKLRESFETQERLYELQQQLIEIMRQRGGDNDDSEDDCPDEAG